MKIWKIVLTTLFCLPIQGYILPEVDNEITPVSVSMSSTESEYYYNYSVVATNAVDKDLSTEAETSSESSPWFKAKLGRTYCVEEVHHYIHPNYHTIPYNHHTCSRDECTCISGYWCTHRPTWWPVSVYCEDDTVPDNVPSDCKLGDTVVIRGGGYHYVWLYEIVIIGREIELISLDLSLTPENEIRAFNGATVELKSTHFFSMVAEGNFWWMHNDSLCLPETCRNITNTPKSSQISLIVDVYTVGAWRCFYTEAASKRVLKSNQVILIGVDVSGTQNPTSVWGIPGTESEVTCSVPFNMTNSVLNNLRWMLNGKVVCDDGFTLNKHGDVLIFKMTEKVYTTTRVQWKIKVTHSRVAVGSLNCRAQYSTGHIIDTPISHLNEIRIESDPELLVLTPDTGAVVTFVIHAPSTPQSRNLDCSLVNPVSKSTDSKDSADGLIFTEIYYIRSSDSMTEIGSKDDLVSQHGVCDYSVRIQNSVQDSLTVTIKYSLIGEAVAITPVLATVGRRAILTTYFTARDLSDVQIKWQKRNGGSINWESLTSDHQYRTLISPIDEKGVMSTKLFIQKLTPSDVTDYRVVIFLSGQQQTCDMISVKSAQATISNVKAVFETSTAIFSMSVLGDIKLLSVFLHHNEGNKDIPISLPDSSAVSGPYTISHRLEEVYFCDGGLYSFRIKLDTGFEFSTDETNLKVKLRCKPPRTPPNTHLKMVEIAESDDYKYVVTCIDAKMVFMNEDAVEVICNTSAGSYYTRIDLSPCLRVVEQVYP